MRKSSIILALFLTPALYAGQTIGALWNDFAVAVAREPAFADGALTGDSSAPADDDTRTQYAAALSGLIADLESYMQTNTFRYAHSQRLPFAKTTRTLYETTVAFRAQIADEPPANDALTNNAFRQRRDAQLVTLQAQVIALLQEENAASHHSGYLYASLVVILSVVLVALVVFVVLYMRRRGRLNELEQTVQNERLITQTTVSVQENERTKMYRELHDTVAQDIKAAHMFTSQLQSLPNQSDEARDLFSKIDGLQKNCVSEIYAVIRNLTPPLLTGDYIQSLEDLCLTVTTLSSVPCKHFIDPAIAPSLRALDDERKLHAYRIIQEALNNAVQHARPSEVSLMITGKDGVIDIFVTDDGTGFDTSDTTAGADTFGLRGMKSRAQVIGATLKITSDTEAGTQIRLSIPIQKISNGGGQITRWIQHHFLHTIYDFKCFWARCAAH